MVNKKWMVTLLALTLAVITAGVFVVPHLQSAHAASATLTASPKSEVYAASSTITVQGNNYGAAESVNIYWNYTGPGTGTLETTATASGTGAFTTRFPVPLAPTGTYTIAGVGVTSGFVATDTFQLQPQLIMKPEAAGPGSTVHVFGNAFGNAEHVNVYWDYTGPSTGTLLTTATGNTTGSFNVTAIIPKTATPGTYPVVGVGQTTNTTASFSFIIYTPTLALAPLSGSAGSTVTVSAYGFQVNEAVSIFWNNGATPILVGKTSSNVYGYLPPTNITIPAGTTPGTYPVKAVGNVSKISVTTNYTVVAPASSLSLASGPVGAAVTVSGQGYAASETVNIIWNYTGATLTVATVQANSAGSFSASFVIPAVTNGAYSVAAVGATSSSVTQNTFTLAAGGAVNPTIGPPSATINVTGTGFLNHESVRYFWDSTSTLLFKGVSNAKGNVSKALAIPTNATPGAHHIILAGETSHVNFTIPITVDTTWNTFGFISTATRVNPYENVVSNSNVASIAPKWNVAVGAGPASSAVYNNGTLYITTPDGKLDAFNAASGASKWQFNSGTGFKNLSSPLVDPATGLVFFGTIGNAGSGIPSPFYAVDAQTGTLKWSEILAWNIFGAPTLSGKTLYIGVARGPNSTTLYALDESTGHITWQYAAKGSVWGTVSVDSSTHTLFAFVGNPVSALVALNANSGAFLWQYAIANGNPYSELSSGISVANGLVYFDGENGTLYALNESAGTLAWSTPVGSPVIGNASSPAVTSGVIYVGSLDGNLYALNATTGALLWKTPTGGGISSSPAVANGVVYVASSDKHFYALDATSGSVLWSFASSAAANSSPIIVNGWLYCASTDGNLYAFSL